MFKDADSLASCGSYLIVRATVSVGLSFLERTQDSHPIDHEVTQAVTVVVLRCIKFSPGLSSVILIDAIDLPKSCHTLKSLVSLTRL